MKLLTSFEAVKKIKAPISITIGYFDGVHLGHLAIFKKLNELKERGTSLIITFTEADLIQNKAFPIETEKNKFKLLKKCNIDVMLILKLSMLKHLSYIEFLQLLKKHMDFSYLVLGKGSSFGKNKEGTEENTLPLQSQLGFSAHYIPLEKENDEIISGSLIRSLILNNDILRIEKLLNRKYKISEKINV